MAVKTIVDIQELLCKSLNAALDKKANDIVVLKVNEVSSFTDYFVICSGSSDRQVQAIAESIQTTVKKAGLLPLGVEGERYGQWILIDYGDFVVHIFYEPVREFYDIEHLWSDVPRLRLDENITHISRINDEDFR